jgi:hypothetical protein
MPAAARIWPARVDHTAGIKTLEMTAVRFRDLRPQPGKSGSATAARTRSHAGRPTSYSENGSRAHGPMTSGFRSPGGGPKPEKRSLGT